MVNTLKDVFIALSRLPPTESSWSTELRNTRLITVENITN